MQVGRIVAMSPLAFNYEREWPADARPKVGDIVWFARYAGALIECAFDGQAYRMVKDKDVAAIIERSRHERDRRSAMSAMKENYSRRTAILRRRDARMPRCFGWTTESPVSISGSNVERRAIVPTCSHWPLHWRDAGGGD